MPCTLPKTVAGTVGGCPPKGLRSLLILSTRSPKRKTTLDNCRYVVYSFLGFIYDHM